LAPAALLIGDSAIAQKMPRGDDIKESAPAPAFPTEPDYKPGFFTPAEWAFVNAACDRLIPKDDTGPGAVELGVPQYIDRQLQTPYGEGGRWYMAGPYLEAAPEFGYQSKLTPREQYRLCIRAIDAYCTQNSGKEFAALDVAAQDDFLKKMENGDIKAEGVSLKTFFSSFLLKNVLEGYFGDPMYGGNKDMGSWKMIGYPGVRADYQDWVTKAGPYPYGPVSLHGQDT
jgi:gluconate 2-dehydrogenase gamma chain